MFCFVFCFVLFCFHLYPSATWSPSMCNKHWLFPSNFTWVLLSFITYPIYFVSVNTFITIGKKMNERRISSCSFLIFINEKTKILCMLQGLYPQRFCTKAHFSFSATSLSIKVPEKDENSRLKYYMWTKQNGINT